MEYIHGTVTEEIIDPVQITKIGQALSHFHSFQSHHPGPVGDGISRGLLWSEGTTTEYALCGSVERLEHWFNRRIKHEGLSLLFKECSFVLCHLDIAPRNILWSEDSLCIVDWASAGYYPRILEWCLLNIVCGRNGPFQDLVMKTMEPLTDWEVEIRDSIVKAWGNSVRYSLYVLAGISPLRTCPSQLQSIHASTCVGVRLRGVGPLFEKLCM